jgi:hypothetical protein
MPLVRVAGDEWGMFSGRGISLPTVSSDVLPACDIA